MDRAKLTSIKKLIDKYERQVKLVPAGCALQKEAAATKEYLYNLVQYHATDLTPDEISRLKSLVARAEAQELEALAIRDGLQEMSEKESLSRDLVLEMIDNILTAGDGPRCRVCGCTDNNACPGGCYWVEDDLCSKCAAKEATDENND